MNNHKSHKPKKPLQSYAKYSGIAFQMLAIIIIGTFAGVKLDEFYPNTYSLFTILFSLIAIGVSMYFVIKQVNKTSNKSK